MIPICSNHLYFDFRVFGGCGRVQMLGRHHRNAQWKRRHCRIICVRVTWVAGKRRRSAGFQKFSSEIPINLRHFHSNPINIAVETGILGLALYLWWIITVLQVARNVRTLDAHYHSLGIAIGAAIISWQVAGLVEYNFGDSEVLYIGYILIGLLGVLAKPAIDSVQSERLK